MKRIGSRRALATTTVLLAALLVSVGCDEEDIIHPSGSKINITIVNSAGTADLTVNVDGPGFHNEDVAMPAVVGGTVSDEFRGNAGDQIDFVARIPATTGGESCHATAEIVDGTVYGQVNVNYEVGVGFTIVCSSGWEESLPGTR